MDNAKIIAVRLAVRLAVDCILDAARVSEPLGAPSGIIYAAFSESGMSLSVYEQIVDYLVSSGKITIRHNRIHLA